MNWWFAFAFAAGVALVMIELGGAVGQYFGCFVLGAVYGAALYKFLEGRKPDVGLNQKRRGLGKMPQIPNPL